MYTADPSLLPALLSRDIAATEELGRAGRDDPAERVLAVLMSSAYRKGSLERSQLDRQRTVMLHTIRQRTAHGDPVPLTLMAFPFKVPNPAKVGGRRLPDLAEFGALMRLARLGRAVATVYEPGIEIELILDGRSLAPVVGLELEEVSAYERYLHDLMVISGVERFVRVHDFEQLVEGQHGHVDVALQRVRSVAEAWWHEQRGSAEWETAFRRMLGMISLRELDCDQAAALMHEAHGGRLGDAHAAIEQRVWQAMIDYRAFDLVVHELDPRPVCFPHAIHATTQERPGRLSMWLVRRGRSHLPWHGVGVLEQDDRVSVVPLSELQARGGYIGVHLADEDTPFLYRQAIA